MDPPDEQPSSAAPSAQRLSRSRSRSRSPRPSRRHDEARPRKSKGGGLRWKDKSRDERSRSREADDKRLERGYRVDRMRSRSRSPRREGRERERRADAERDGDKGRERAGAENGEELKGGADGEKKKKKAKEKREKKEKKAKPVQNEPMIVVYVNDRLGTKAAIPCLPSDPIKLFKAQVAARIGRRPHEILLKRQGERPFKDILTLEDYGICNNVQLDLELDTGD